MIKFNCPKCGKEFKSKDEYAGRQFACTNCNEACCIPTLKSPGQPSAIATADSVPNTVPPTPPPLKKLAKVSANPQKQPTDEPSASADELPTFEAVHTDPHQTAAAISKRESEKEAPPNRIVSFWKTTFVKTILAAPQVRPKVFQVVAGLLLLLVGGFGAVWLLRAPSPPPESPKVPAGKVVESPKEAPEVVTFRKDVANFAKETRIAVKLFASGTTKKAAVEKYEYLVDLKSRIDLPLTLVSPDGLDVRPRLLLISSEIAEIKMWLILPVQFHGTHDGSAYPKLLACSNAIDSHLENLYIPLTAKEQADVAELLKQ